jgi:hypothetical protein
MSGIWDPDREGQEQGCGRPWLWSSPGVCREPASPVAGPGPTRGSADASPGAVLSSHGFLRRRMN